MQAAVSSATHFSEGREAWARPKAGLGASRHLNSAVASAAGMGGIVLLGALLVAGLEGWSLPDAVYWAVVTCSSVGFGDLAPSAASRPLAACFVLPAVGLFTAAAAGIARAAMAAERVSFFQDLGARRRRTPRTSVDLKVPKAASRRDLSDATFQSGLALGVRRRHPPKSRQKNRPALGPRPSAPSPRSSRAAWTPS
jgi:hypothetical protein